MANRNAENPPGDTSAIVRTRVLLADDESHVRTYLKAMVTGLQFEVVGEASNGRMAVEMFRRLKPDLLLMDLNMPVMRGDEALKEILAEMPDARVVMLSSLADRETVETCLELGAAHYILKDCSWDEMREAIMESLE
jgi:two-component system chemotaxis response regulator CheY